MYLFSPFCIVSNIMYSINAIQCLMISWTIFFSKYKRERYYINNLFINKGQNKYSQCTQLLNMHYPHFQTVQSHNTTNCCTILSQHWNIILLNAIENLFINQQTTIPCVLYHTHEPESYSVKQNDGNFNLLQRSLK